MKYRWLGWFGVGLALGCWAGMVAMRVTIFGLPFDLREALVEMGLVLAGSVIFWRWIVATLLRQAAEVRLRTDYLEALHAASIALTTEHELTSVLQKVVDLSRGLLNAKYGALGILGDDGESIEQMVTSGMSPAQRDLLTDFPRGHGLLGAPIAERRAVRVPSIARDMRSRGFPSNHPAMYTFLGVPIMARGRMFGNLYLTDKLSDPTPGSQARRSAGGPFPFTQEDQDILEMFANQAAIAIVNAQLYRENQQLAVLQERERFGMDLHDGVIQSIYAIGLMLEDSRHRAATEVELAQKGIDVAISGLNQVIRDIRSYIHDLRTHQHHGHSLQQGLEELTREVQTYSALKIELDLTAQCLRRVTPQQVPDLLQIVREALSNTQKHARATRVAVRFSCRDGTLELSIADDGVGLPPTDQAGSGYGLRNMRERAQKLRGDLKVQPEPGGGTCVVVSIPCT